MYLTLLTPTPSRHQATKSCNNSSTKMLIVAFTGVIAVRERGITLPEAGHEGPWFRENMAWFERQYKEEGDQTWEPMLKEMQTRPDLTKLIK